MQFFDELHQYVYYNKTTVSIAIALFSRVRKFHFWKNGKDVRMYGYSAGVWGPENADQLIDGDFGFRNPGPNLADDPGFCVIC